MRFPVLAITALVLAAGAVVALPEQALTTRATVIVPAARLVMRVSFMNSSVFVAEQCFPISAAARPTFGPEVKRGRVPLRRDCAGA